MTINEQEKFLFLANIIKQYCPVKITKRFYNPERSIRKPIDGSCYNDQEKTEIYISILPELNGDSLMNEDLWSEAAAVLLHEFGHCWKFTKGERKAWSNGEKWVDKNFPLLKPLRFNEIRDADLLQYKQLMANGKLPKNKKFEY